LSILREEVEKLLQSDPMSHRELLDGLSKVPEDVRDPKFQRALDVFSRWEHRGLNLAALGLIRDAEDLIVLGHPGIEETAGFKLEYADWKPPPEPFPPTETTGTPKGSP